MRDTVAPDGFCAGAADVVMRGLYSSQIGFYRRQDATGDYYIDNLSAKLRTDDESLRI
jgi:hypothetical protein